MKNSALTKSLTVCALVVFSVALLAPSSSANAQAGRRRAMQTGAANESIAPNVEALYLQALRELNTGQHAAALATLDRVVELNPQFPEAHFARGQALAKLKRPAEAAAALKGAVALAPTNARARYELGVLLRADGKHAAAIDEFKEAARLEPANARAYQSLGETYLTLYQAGAATAAFLRAVEADRAFADAAKALERLIESNETLGIATNAFGAAVAARPLSAPARYYFARALFLMNRRRDALQQSKALEKLDPALAARLQKEIGA